MKKQLIQDLPIYLNAASVTLLAFETDLSTVSRIGLLIIAAISFMWFSENMEKKTKL